MPSNDEWQLSWSKLRDRFEDWSLSYSGMRLCTRKIDGPLHGAKSLHSIFNLAEPAIDIHGNEREGVIVQDALGMGTCHCVGLQDNSSLEWWIASQKLADSAKQWGEVSELEALRAELSSASEQFEALADQASLILSQRPEGVAIRYPWPDRGAWDSRLWVCLLLVFAEDFQHSTLTLAGTLPVFALGVFQPCNPAGLEYIDPNPGAASMIVLELLRTGDWKEKLGITKPADSLTKMTQAAANEKAMAIAEKDPNFIHGTQRAWADAIGCSVGLVGKTTLWQETMRRTGRERKGQGTTPKKVSLTKAVEETVGEGTKHNELENLLKAQEKDYDPSPCDPKGRNPICRD
ncbi:MAG: hypothetical protein GXP26_05470 [Planctomycetes bacterium]|nr:hypothetical protein [Planctomycetota bacterium]